MLRGTPQLSAAGLAAVGEMGNPGGGGGGSVQPVTPPAPASESVAAGASLADVTFSAFTDPGSRIASYSATKTNVSGSATISGTGLGPYAISGDADGETLLIELDALDASANVVATATYVGTIAPASDGPSTILSTADFGNYDFTTTGGTGGSGGAGPHTLPDGTTCTVHVVGSGATVAKVEGGVFVGNGDTSNYYNIEFDLGADTEWINVWALAQWTLGETAASGSLWMKQSEVAGDDANKADDLQFLTTSSTATRHRFLNSATTFNNVLDTTGLSLGSADQLEMRWRATNMYATCETRQGTGTLPEWKGAAMTSVAGDVRATTNSFRRYLYVRVGGQDATLNLLLQKGS